MRAQWWSNDFVIWGGGGMKLIFYTKNVDPKTYTENIYCKVTSKYIFFKYNIKETHQ